MIASILLGLDGEAHSGKAEAQALWLAGRLGARLCAVYVVDPYLKKFTHEIYAVNRDACREHLDRELEKEGRAALARFTELAGREGVAVEERILNGDPAEVLAELAAAETFDLVIIGGKPLRGAWQRFESRNLPERLHRLITGPLLVVR